VLVLCLVAARLIVNHSIATAISCETIEVLFRPTRLARGEVLVRVELRNASGVTATYQGLEAKLGVGGRDYPYTVEGLKPGRRIRGGESLELEVTVRMGPGDLVAVGLGAAMNGEVEVEVEGQVYVKVFGLELGVPLQVDRRVSVRPGR
jgi:hypothetical protein